MKKKIIIITLILVASLCFQPLFNTSARFFPYDIVVYGTVKTESGQDLYGAKVTLLIDGQPVASDYYDEQSGEYRISHTMPGGLILPTMKCEMTGYYTKTGPAPMREGTYNRNWVLELKHDPITTFRGCVRKTTQNPAYIVGAEVLLIKTSGEILERDITDSVGNYIFGSVQHANPTTYYIKAWKDGHQAHVAIVQTFEDFDGSYFQNCFLGESDSVKRYSLSVGVSNYLYGDTPEYPNFIDLDYADDDAVSWYNFFRNDLDFNIPYVWKLTNGEATKVNIMKYLKLLTIFADPTDKIAFTFSGHGDRTAAGTVEYICPYEYEPDDSFSDGISDQELADVLVEQTYQITRGEQEYYSTDVGKVFVFLDSCHSGGFGPQLSNIYSSYDLYGAFACAAYETTGESAAYGHGLWTYWYLIIAWQHPVDGYDGDPDISLNAVFAVADDDHPSAESVGIGFAFY